MFVRITKLCSTLLILALIGACSKNFVVTGEFPQPLVQRIPIVVQMQYSDAFKTYKYLEKDDDRAIESVEFGEAQVSLFNRIFGSLFTLANGDTASVDIKIEPQVQAFQYSAPVETKLKLYEVWIKYRLKITDQKDQLIADWIVKGYGKTPTGMLSSQSIGLNTASNIALRDVGAQLAIGFRSQASIEDYLASRSRSKLANKADAPELANDSGKSPVQIPLEIPNEIPNEIKPGTP